MRLPNVSGSVPLSAWSRQAPSKLPVFAFVFVFFTLAVLALAPVFLVNRMNEGAKRIELLFNPANALAARLTLTLTREVAEHRGLLLSGNTMPAARFRSEYETERAVIDSLYPLAQRLGPEAVARLQRVTALSHRWHALLLQMERASPAELRSDFPQHEALKDSLLDAALQFAQTVDRAPEAEMRAGRTLAQQLRMLSFLFGSLGVLSVIIVGWFARQQRALTADLRRAIEEELRQRQESERRRAELDRITESRARLLRGFTHDVKNPMSAADGYLQLLEAGIVGELADAQKTSVGKARRSLGAAFALIEDLLELARTEAGHISVNKVPVDLSAAAEDVGEEHRAQAEAKGLALRLERSEEAAIVHTDPHRVRQILSNLISNAVKYTPSGAITVRIGRRRADHGCGAKATLVVEVVDTGPGIPEDRREDIFQEFTRLDPGASPGAGVGLAISRRIAHALGGNITIEPGESGGSKFVLWLPPEAEAGQQVRKRA